MDLGAAVAVSLYFILSAVSKNQGCCFAALKRHFCLCLSLSLSVVACLRLSLSARRSPVPELPAAVDLFFRAKVSTASFGQHDKRPKGEGGPAPQKKRQKAQHFENAAAETAAYREQLRLLLSTKAANQAHGRD